MKTDRRWYRDGQYEWVTHGIAVTPLLPLTDIRFDSQGHPVTALPHSEDVPPEWRNPLRRILLQEPRNSVLSTLLPGELYRKVHEAYSEGLTRSADPDLEAHCRARGAELRELTDAYGPGTPYREGLRWELQGAAPPGLVEDSYTFTMTFDRPVKEEVKG